MFSWHGQWEAFAAGLKVVRVIGVHPPSSLPARLLFLVMKTVLASSSLSMFFALGIIHGSLAGLGKGRS